MYNSRKRDNNNNIRAHSNCKRACLTASTSISASQSSDEYSSPITPTLLLPASYFLSRSSSSSSSSSSSIPIGSCIIHPPSLTGDFAALNTTKPKLIKSLYTSIIDAFYDHRYHNKYQPQTYSCVTDMKSLTNPFHIQSPTQRRFDPDLLVPTTTMDLTLFTCQICHMIMDQPVNIPCPHSFCLDCIRQLYQHSTNTTHHQQPRCPECRKYLPSDLKSVSVSGHIQRSVNSLLIQCPYNCGQTMTLDRFTKHYDTECENAILVCKFCSSKCEKKNWTSHENQCPNIPVMCSLCMIYVPQGQLQKHIRFEENRTYGIPQHCRNQVVCPFGCTGESGLLPLVLPITSYLNHHYQCSKRRWICPYCGYITCFDDLATHLHSSSSSSSSCHLKQRDYMFSVLSALVLQGDDQQHYSQSSTHLHPFSYLLHFNEQYIQQIQKINAADKSFCLDILTSLNSNSHISITTSTDSSSSSSSSQF